MTPKYIQVLYVVKGSFTPDVMMRLRAFRGEMIPDGPGQPIVITRVLKTQG